MYGGPDAGDPSELFEPIDALDLTTASALGINPRRHTIATMQPQATLSLVMHATCSTPCPYPAQEHFIDVSSMLTCTAVRCSCASTRIPDLQGPTFLMAQGREFAWLRPNEVVTRPTSASGGRGLDYLWLRSRVVVKLSPEIRRRVARYSGALRVLHVGMQIAQPLLGPAPVPAHSVTCVERTCRICRQVLDHEATVSRHIVPQPHGSAAGHRLHPAQRRRRQQRGGCCAGGPPGDANVSRWRRGTEGQQAAHNQLAQSRLCSRSALSESQLV